MIKDSVIINAVKTRKKHIPQELFSKVMKAVMTSANKEEFQERYQVLVTIVCTINREINKQQNNPVQYDAQEAYAFYFDAIKDFVLICTYMDSYIVSVPISTVSSDELDLQKENNEYTIMPAGWVQDDIKVIWKDLLITL